jgi:hypothetical protein
MRCTCSQRRACGQDEYAERNFCFLRVFIETRAFVSLGSTNGL